MLQHDRTLSFSVTPTVDGKVIHTNDKIFLNGMHWLASECYEVRLPARNADTGIGIDARFLKELTAGCLRECFSGIELAARSCPQRRATGRSEAEQ